VDREGNMLALEIDDLTASALTRCFPLIRVECNQVLNLTGGPYKHKEYRAKGTVVFQNKAMMCQYPPWGTDRRRGRRAYGRPGRSEARHRSRRDAKEESDSDDAYPYKSASGMRFEALSHHQCMDKLLSLMKYDELRKEQSELRKKGVYRGIGLSSFIEVTNPSPMFYGVAVRGSRLRTAAHQAGRERSIIAATGVTEQDRNGDDHGADRGDRARRRDELREVLTATPTRCLTAAAPGPRARRESAAKPSSRRTRPQAQHPRSRRSDPENRCLGPGHRRRQGGEERQRQGLSLAELRALLLRGNELPWISSRSWWSRALPGQGLRFRLQQRRSRLFFEVDADTAS